MRSESVPRPDRYDRLADLAVFALAAAWIARLVPQALAARLQTDECFHAWVSRWIGAHGTIPDAVPGLYGGFPYFYPPLFHLLGGLGFTFGGETGFRLVNVVVVALVLLVVAQGAARLEARGAARWGVAACVATSFLALHGVRLYVEALSTLLVTAAAMRLAATWRDARSGDAVQLGIAAGLAIVAKLSALVLPPLLAALAVVEFVRRNAPRGRALAIAAAIATGVAMPWLARCAERFGSPLYPMAGRGVHPLLMQLNVRHFTPSPMALWSEMPHRFGIAILGLLLLAIAAAFARRRFPAELGMALGGLALVAAAPLQAMLASRHLLPLVVAIGALAAVAAARLLADAPRARRALDVALLACAAWAVLAMPRLRAVEDLDEPVEMDAAFAAIRAHVPADETVLARETYDVLWYTGRPANWPVPFGQADPPVGLFLTSDPDSIARDLVRHRIRWVLLTDDAGPPRFDGGDWPQPVLDGLSALVRAGRAAEVWREEDHALLRVGP